MLEQDGHFWKNPEIVGDRCVHCGRRIEHYSDADRHFIPGESTFSQMLLLVCDCIIDNNPANSESIEPVGWGTYNRVAPTRGVYAYHAGIWYRELYPQTYLIPSRKLKLDEIPHPPGYYTGSSFKPENFHEDWSATID